MKYRLFGRSGMRVSEIALGTMSFGDGWGFGANEAESQRIIHAYLDAGGNFIDGANKYHEGQSETFVGRAIADRRDSVVLATKYTLSMKNGDPNASGNHRKNLVQSIEASLKRLGTDYIDLMWLHAWDFTTPVDEVMRALDDLVRASKILHVGVSDTPAWIVAQANTLAELRGWSRFVGLQCEYSLIERTIERELLPMANAFDMSVTAWGAMGGGVLTGKYTRGNAEDSKRAAMNQGRLTDRNTAIARQVDAIADSIGESSARVALAWVRAQGRAVIPIVGTRKLSQLEDILGCLELELADEHLAALDEVSRIQMGFPHDFLEIESIKDVVYGDTRDRFDW